MFATILEIKSHTAQKPNNNQTKERKAMKTAINTTDLQPNQTFIINGAVYSYKIEDEQSLIADKYFVLYRHESEEIAVIYSNTFYVTDQNQPMYQELLYLIQKLQRQLLKEGH